ncbi:MAG: formate--tetrahydrofolate ligase [Deltaproteobacteria bacterium]|nr:formate--tetrahydrofolate ligase [Deltaproteobacteria bacterium]MBI3078078.1 formate--tetrahydrofolate ligase [Deltaproteobacteria bacterium]
MQGSVRPILEVAARLGLDPAVVEPYGRFKAKVALEAIDPARATGQLILVSAITPTHAGEGKTTTSIALAQGLARLGQKVCVALREPSLGPCFGIKGGGAGGGAAQLYPMEEINLHLTGDIHAVGAAHNLLAALVDNELFHGTAPSLDPLSVTWGRVMDMNDRSLRHVVIGLGGKAMGVPREASFAITAASEVMAILCLAQDYRELTARLGRIIIGATFDRAPVTAADLRAHGAMAVLLREALKPNLVQTVEGVPAVVHGGPFGNIAHGCNSILATRLALQYANLCVTEAGFGFDLGGEKFMHIKARAFGLRPRVVVLVATARALKLHGGAAPGDPNGPNLAALERGLPNLEKQLENIRKFGLTPVVAINRFAGDPEEELGFLRDACRARGVPVALSDGFARGGEGALELAELVLKTATLDGDGPRHLYEPDEPVDRKIRAIAREIYGAADVNYSEAAKQDLRTIERWGMGHLPICVAKSQMSLSDNPKLLGRPTGFDLMVQDIKVNAGAGFLVVRTGPIMTMPGLPKEPAAWRISLGEDGTITGLF